MRNVADMTSQELTDEWLACEREQGDPASDASRQTALVRQVDIEREQDRREAMEAGDVHGEDDR